MNLMENAMKMKTKTKTAKLIKDNLPGAIGHQALYKLNPPMEKYDGTKFAFVVVSSIAGAFDTGRPETYIFGADETGKIVSYSEMGASQRDTQDHELVLRESGYTIKA